MRLHEPKNIQRFSFLYPKYEGKIVVIKKIEQRNNLIYIGVLIPGFPCSEKTSTDETWNMGAIKSEINFSQKENQCYLDLAGTPVVSLKKLLIDWLK